MLEDEPAYDYDLDDADIVEEPSELLTQDEAHQAVNDRDHQIAVDTAKELIRQRGILMKDLETALNMCRRYRGILRDNYLPDPNAAGLEELLKKYGMTGKSGAAPPKRDFSPDEQERIAAVATGIKRALTPEDEIRVMGGLPPFTPLPERLGTDAAEKPVLYNPGADRW